MDNIAKKASKEFKVVVSGFAKGFDRQALDSALKKSTKFIDAELIAQLPNNDMSAFESLKYYREAQKNMLK